MPFDPDIPATNAEATSAMFRGQFNGLKDLIDAIQTITAAQIDAVNTVDAGQPAAVSLGVTGNTLHFSFDLPRGNDGSSGVPVTSFLIDSVTTLEPGEAATAESSFDGSSVHLSFGIPRGNDGGEGPQGQPGEVTQSALDDAVASTSANTNGVDFLSLSPGDPPTQGEMQAVIDKINELIQALRR